MPLSPQQIEQIRKEAEAKFSLPTIKEIPDNINRLVVEQKQLHDVKMYIAGATAQAMDMFEFSEWHSYEGWTYIRELVGWVNDSDTDCANVISTSELYVMYQKQKEGKNEP